MNNWGDSVACCFPTFGGSHLEALVCMIELYTKSHQERLRTRIQTNINRIVNLKSFVIGESKCEEHSTEIGAIILQIEPQKSA